MDEFAQSRGDDDLFDDEIVPIEPSSEPGETIAAQLEQVSLEPAAIQSVEARPILSTPSTPSRGRGRGKGRGRGGQVRDQQKPSGLADSKYATKPTAEPDALQAQIPITETSPPEKERPETATSKDSEVPSDAPTGPSNPTPARPPAVRGDRTATGGVRKPKLTEAELSEKLAAAKERSQNLAAAHARAQADAENFAERERLASEKRVKESVERKAMEGERARNRERKLRALGGREWDIGKDEEQQHLPDRERRQGNFGDDRDNDLSMYEWKEDRGRGGRGGRGRGRGNGNRGGRGRGAVDDGRNGNGRQQQQRQGPHMTQTQPDVHAEADFPALPPSKTGAGTSLEEDKEQKQKMTTTISRKESDRPIGSWADQVESSEAART